MIARRFGRPIQSSYRSIANDAHFKKIQKHKQQIKQHNRHYSDNTRQLDHRLDGSQLDSLTLTTIPIIVLKALAHRCCLIAQTNTITRAILIQAQIPFILTFIPVKTRHAFASVVRAEC